MKESMRTAVRFPKAVDFRDLNIGICTVLCTGTIKGVQAVMKTYFSPAQGEAIRHRYIKPEYLFIAMPVG